MRTALSDRSGEKRSGLPFQVYEFVDDALDARLREAAEYLLAHHHDRSETAGTHAAQRIEREEAVGGRFAHLDAQLALEFVEHLLRTADIAPRRRLSPPGYPAPWLSVPAPPWAGSRVSPARCAGC